MAAQRVGKPALTKAELARGLHESLGLTLSQTGPLVDHVFEAIKDALADSGDGEVKITRFGTFKVRQKNARMGRNPNTRQDVLIEERKVLSFHASQVLKNQMKKEIRP